MKKPKFTRMHEQVMEVYDEDFKHTKKEKKKNWIDRICEAISKIGLTIKAIGIILIVVVLILVCKWYLSIGEKINPSVEKTLENRYNTNFVIKTENTDSKGNGTYVVYPKGYKQFEFVVTKDKKQINENLRGMVIKSYWNSLPDTEKEGLNLIEKGNKVDIKLENYNQLEWALLKYYKFYKESQKEFPGNITLNSHLIIGDYETYISIIEKDSIDLYLNRIKYDYFNYLIENNKDTTNIPKSEIEKIWKPKELKLIVNGNIIDPKESIAYYWIEKEEYSVTYLKPLTKYINNLDFVGTTWFGLGNQKFKYKDKEVELDYIVTESKLKKYFNAEIKKNIEKRTMEINIK